MHELTSALGRRVLSLLAYVLESVGLLVRTVAVSFALRRHGIRVVRRVLSMQMFFTGTQAVLPVTIASIAVGTLVVSQAVEYLPADYVVSIVDAILLREVLPLLTAFLVIGRSGTAITVEIGTMKLEDELSALRIMRIPFEHFIVLPRLIGMVASFVLLMAYAYVASLAGGYYVWFGLSESAAPFPVTYLLEGVEMEDVVLSVVKVALFGSVVAITSVQHGLSVGESRREIPIATSRSLVRATLICAIINTVVSLAS